MCDRGGVVPMLRRYSCQCGEIWAHWSSFLSIPFRWGVGYSRDWLSLFRRFVFFFIAIYMRDFERSCLVYWSCNSQLPSLRPSAEDRWSVTPGHRMKYPSTYLLYWVQVSVSMYCIFCICKWTSLPRLTLQPWWLVETLSWGPLECYTGAPHKISTYLFIILSTS